MTLSPVIGLALRDRSPANANECVEVMTTAIQNVMTIRPSILPAFMFSKTVLISSSLVL
jgi:hypothetical protein